MALAVDSISFDAVRVALNLVANMQRLEMTARFFIQRLEQSGISEQRRRTVSKIDYQALREAAEKATPGEWCTDDHYGVIADTGLNANYYIASCLGPDNRFNKRFIAAANPAAVLTLLNELETAKKRIAELEAEPVSQTYKLNELSGNSPVTPDGWISCSERMPDDKQYVWFFGKSRGFAGRDTFEGYYDWSRNKWWAVTDIGEEPASKVTHWMPLPEPPQEAK
ncbi:DUF551 domain-containing protein [Escherichia coli]|nr:DUF551 domain-containing protein [Escherichia coli]